MVRETSSLRIQSASSLTRQHTRAAWLFTQGPISILESPDNDDNDNMSNVTVRSLCEFTSILLFLLLLLGFLCFFVRNKYFFEENLEYAPFERDGYTVGTLAFLARSWMWAVEVQVESSFARVLPS